MNESLVALLLIVFFAMVGIRELQSNTTYGLILGAVAILIAVAFIIGRVSEF